MVMATLPVVCEQLEVLSFETCYFSFQSNGVMYKVRHGGWMQRVYDVNHYTFCLTESWLMPFHRVGELQVRTSECHLNTALFCVRC